MICTVPRAPLLTPSPPYTPQSRFLGSVELGQCGHAVNGAALIWGVFWSFGDAWGVLGEFLSGVWGVLSLAIFVIYQIVICYYYINKGVREVRECYKRT